MRRVATIDLGTNTVRLLVAEVGPGSWQGVAEEQRITRLGESQGRDGRLAELPMIRTVQAVGEMVVRARALGAVRVRIVGTSAVREATNRLELLHRVREATGLAVEVVSGDEEARLTLLGVRGGLPGLAEPFLLLDVGGGSTELVLARPGREPLALSLRLGVVGLAERHVGPGPMDAAELAGLGAEVAAALDQAPPGAFPREGTPLIGTAGTITTLAALDLGLAAYDPAAVHGHRLRRAAVERLQARLTGLSLAERAGIPCLPPGRADVIIPGIAILLAVMDRIAAEGCLVSDHGLREGILYELLRTG